MYCVLTVLCLDQEVRLSTKEQSVDCGKQSERLNSSFPGCWKGSTLLLMPDV